MKPFAPLFTLAVLAGPTQALELAQPEVSFARDCSVTITLQLVPDPDQDPKQVALDIAAPPTHRKIGHAYPAWADAAQLVRFDRDGAHHVQISSTEALPTHPSTLVLALDGGAKTLVLHTVEVPACNHSGKRQDVQRGNTLLGLALPHSRAMGVDVDRLMLAIQLYNREAFIHDNINLLRTGPRLYIPSNAEVARLSLTRGWVIEEILYQNDQWAQWQMGLGRPGASARLEERQLRIVPINLMARLGVIEPLQPAAETAAPPETASEDPDASPPKAPAEAEAADPQEPAAATDETVPPAAPRGGLLESWMLWVIGGLLLAWLNLFAVRRLVQARDVRRALGDIPDRAARATSALDLAHAHAKAGEYSRAHPLLRLVLSDGTPQERAEAKKLRDQIR